MITDSLLGHCLEHLRQAVMCHSDVSTLYYRWDEADKMSKMSMEITHSCRKFEKIQDWAYARFFDEFDRHTRTD